LTGPVGWDDVIGSDLIPAARRRVLKWIATQRYRVLVRILAARSFTSIHDALIVHRLSRLHSATPPEGKLLMTLSLSATNSFWREACLLSPGMSSLRLAPT
jgi:hypothetical protein